MEPIKTKTMETVLRILEDAVISLQLEVRIHTKECHFYIAEKCRDEIRQCKDAIEILENSTKN